MDDQNKLQDYMKALLIAIPLSIVIYLLAVLLLGWN